MYYRLNILLIYLFYSKILSCYGMLHTRFALRKTSNIIKHLHYSSTRTSIMSKPLPVSSQENEQQTSYKRKVALVISYVGSNYHGLQLNPNKNENIKFIEGELLQALYSIGAILPTNNLDRIDWSRSSRTDKGVHAARLVISAKLEILPEWLPTFDLPVGERQSKHLEYLEGRARIKNLIEELNKKLPSDIRAISCIRINKSFVARNACSWREYEYVLPLSLLLAPAPAPVAADMEHTLPLPHTLPLSSDHALPPIPIEETLPPVPPASTASELTLPLPPLDTTPPTSLQRYKAYDPTTLTPEQAVQHLNAALNQFVGVHDFHNFNNMRKKAIEEAENNQKNNKKIKKNNTRNNKNKINNDTDSVDNLEESDLEDEIIDDIVCSTTTMNSDNIVTEVENTATTTPTATTTTPATTTGVYDTWIPEERVMLAKFRQRIYKCDSVLQYSSSTGEPMVAVTVRGSGFLIK